LEDAKNAFPGKGHLKPEQDELRKKDREIARLTMERDILKNALGYFAKVKE
jgi:transposase